MCDPVVGATVGMFKANAENAALKANWRHRKDLEEMGTENALEALVTKYRQAGMRQMQERMSRSQEMAMIAKKAAGVKAAATVRAAKGGVSGQSVSALTQQFERDALESMGIRQVEGEWADAMVAQTKDAFQQEADARIQSVQAGPPPSSSAMFMNMISQMVQGYIAGSKPDSGLTTGGAEAATAATTSLPSYMPSSAIPSALGVAPNIGALDPMRLSAPAFGSSALFPSSVSSLAQLGTQPMESFFGSQRANLGLQDLSIGSMPSSALPFRNPLIPTMNRDIFGLPKPFMFSANLPNLGGFNITHPFGSLQIGGSY